MLLLAGLLLANSGCMCTYITYQAAKEALKTPEPTEPPTAFSSFGRPDGLHPEVPFSDMVYERPDIDELTERLNGLQRDLDAGAPVDELLAEYEQVQRLYDDADSQMSLAYALYALDVTDPLYKDEYGDLIKALNELDLIMTDVSIAMLESEEVGESAKSDWGEEYVNAVYEGESLNSPEIQELINKEQDLIFLYDELYSAFKVTVDGEDWSLEELAPAYYEGRIDYEEYVEIYDAYFAALNVEAGEIFVELLGIRNEIARRLGYGSYAAYVYDCYSRDYSVTEIGDLHDAVKRYIAPLYAEALMQNVEIYTLAELTFDQNSCLAKLQQIAADFSERVLEALNYMLRNKLYDFDVNKNKMQGSFTTYFSNYKAPFIFSQWEGGSADVATLIHELGHFTNYYHNAPAGWSVNDPLDLAEVDSQGLELLLIPYYDSFYRRNTDAAVDDRLIDGLYAIVTGCMEDEFQQLVYADPGMTLPEMNALYKQLAGEYGLTGYTGNEWVAIHHTFQSPMYYISYATSMALSMQLYRLSAEDYEAAKSAYEGILMRPPYSEFRDVAEQNGLSDPISEGAIRDLADFLKAELISED